MASSLLWLSALPGDQVVSRFLGYHLDSIVLGNKRNTWHANYWSSNFAKKSYCTSCPLQNLSKKMVGIKIPSMSFGAKKMGKTDRCRTSGHAVGQGSRLRGQLGFSERCERHAKNGWGKNAPEKHQQMLVKNAKVGRNRSKSSIAANRI